MSATIIAPHPVGFNDSGVRWGYIFIYTDAFPQDFLRTFPFFLVKIAPANSEPPYVVFTRGILCQTKRLVVR